MHLTSGKRRGLQQLSTHNGLFLVLAIDHREVFRTMLQQGYKKTVEFEDIVSSKMDIIKQLSPWISGVLLDPIYSAYQSIDRDILPKDKGMMVSIEGNDYSVAEFNKNTYLLEGIDVASIKRMGASCVKLFMYYNPNSEISYKQDLMVKDIGASCQYHDIAFLLEPILYPIEQKKLTIKDKIRLTLDMLKRFKPMAVDIFKIEFPGDVMGLSYDNNLEICKEVSKTLRVPWITLSSGVDLELLKQQVTIASVAGASGIAIGRTLWQNYLLDKDKNISLNQMTKSIKDVFNIIMKNGKNWRAIIDTNI